MKLHSFSTLAVVILLCQPACKEDETIPPPIESFSGILLADANGNILGGDTTDFQPRPQTNGQQPGNYSFICAFPNPVDGNSVSVKFQIPQSDTILIRAYDRPNALPVDTIFHAFGRAGSHIILWNWSGTEGIFRAEMTTSSGFQSYGDIQFR